MTREELASVLIEVAEDLRSGRLRAPDVNRAVLERVGGIESHTLIFDLIQIAGTAAILASHRYTHDELQLVLMGIKVDASTDETA